jgi:hypothetical protein
MVFFNGESLSGATILFAVDLALLQFLQLASATISESLAICFYRFGSASLFLLPVNSEKAKADQICPSVYVS